MAVKYVVRLDSTGYYSKNVRWKTVSKKKATWFTFRKEALKVRNWFATLKQGYRPSVEEIEDE